MIDKMTEIIYIALANFSKWKMNVEIIMSDYLMFKYYILFKVLFPVANLFIESILIKNLYKNVFEFYQSS